MPRPSSHKKTFLIGALCLLVLFLIWRMIRPMNIFVVSDEFARPMAMTVPDGLDSLRASECGGCHPAIYKEWQASMHAKAWTDPYFQVDYVFDGSQQICLNCHIPLQNQQENLVLGFQDRERFEPVLKPNPAFDPQLRQEGVTCVVCHIRDGVIIGPYGDTDAPHLTRFDATMTSGMGICRKCHVVSGKSWDTFFRMPPCGTVAEITLGEPDHEINCVKCHMPAVTRPLSKGSDPRPGRMHLWKGGHDQDMVRNALQVDLDLTPQQNSKGKALLTLTNTGADHFLPTGTPDRQLTVEFMLKKKDGGILKSKTYTLKRRILWRPFIIDLKDNRLAKDKPRTFSFSWKADPAQGDLFLEITVRYHLLDEARRKRIGYQNSDPISFVLYHYSDPVDSTMSNQP